MWTLTEAAESLYFVGDDGTRVYLFGAGERDIDSIAASLRWDLGAPLGRDTETLLLRTPEGEWKFKRQKRDPGSA